MANAPNIPSLDRFIAALRANPTADRDIGLGALLLARDEFPALDVEGYLSELDAMAHELKPRLTGPLCSQWEQLCRYLFHEMGYHGNRERYYDPANSYLNRVMDRRTGIPITLTAVVMAVGQRAGLCVEGIGLPGHFIARLRDFRDEILFDPFDTGRRLTMDDCYRLVQEATGTRVELSPEHFQKQGTLRILQRMCNNLRGIYLATGDHRRAAKVLTRLVQIDENDAVAHRDLGYCAVRLGEPAMALTHLQRYLDRVAYPPDREQVEHWLRHARRQIAERN